MFSEANPTLHTIQPAGFVPVCSSGMVALPGALCCRQAGTSFLIGISHAER